MPYLRPLTVKLSGRTMPPDQRRGRILSSSAHGAKPPTFHGPLQRLLDIMSLPIGVNVELKPRSDAFHLD